LFEQCKNDFENASSKTIDLLKKYGYRFYTIKRTPSRSNKLNFTIKMLEFIRNIVLGSKMEVIECLSFTEAFYSIIIAVYEQNYISDH
jgi:hypothetical protein